MSTTVSLNGSDYIVPSQGENPPWGDNLHDVVVALADSVNAVTGSSDIPLSSFTLANNQVSTTNIIGASFNTSLVRSFILEYSIYRATSLTETTEVGTLYGSYKSNAMTWDLAQTNSGSSSGITFSLTSLGQLQYTSTSLAGSSYVGTMKFKASSFLQ